MENVDFRYCFNLKWKIEWKYFYKIYYYIKWIYNLKNRNLSWGDVLVIDFLICMKICVGIFFIYIGNVEFVFFYLLYFF